MKVSHKDFDFINSHKLGSISSTAGFADEFFADAGLDMPNQNALDTEYTPPVPAIPYGCTSYTAADLATDLTRVLRTPVAIENITHANANGGGQIRDSLSAAIRLDWIKQYFNITVSGQLDAFDTFRLAQLTGINMGEKRSISWGTPWFPSWERAIQAGLIIMPMPTTDEIGAVNLWPWHNSKLDGWTTKNGVMVYRDKSWQGRQIGEGGFVYFPRDVINKVMTIQGTGAFTASNMPVPPVRVSLSTLQWLLSVLRILLSRYVA